MTPALALALVVLLAVGLVKLQAFRRALAWRAGRPAMVDWAAGLRALPRRYLHDVHAVVARDPYAARMHAIAAGGLIAAAAIALAGVVPGAGRSAFYGVPLALAGLAALAGGMLVGRRRAPVKPPRLSGGRFRLLPPLLTAFAGGVVLVGIASAAGAEGFAAALGWLGVAAAAAGLFGLAVLTGDGPMRHAVAGALHLAAHPRPGRFEGRRETALRPLNLDRAEKLGAEMPSDFAWNRLLGFDACIQCGRCEVACPAFAAGQPLNPKKLIQDLVHGLAPGGAPYTGSPYPNARPVAGVGGPELPVVGLEAMVHPDTLWSCTTCRACVEECPMMIEHVDAIVDLRRFQTMELGAVPEKAAAPLTALRRAEEPGGRALAARGDFAAGLPLPMIAARAADAPPAEVLLWLGEGAYDLRYGRTLRALLRLLQAAGVDYAVLGAEERDCGDLARRLGDEATFQDLARANIDTLSRHRFARILTADPHALHVIRNEYPAFGGRFEVVHHSAFLDELVAAGRLAPGALAGAVTYHDPCYLGRYNGEIEAPRRLIDRLGLERREMARSGKRSMCCGGGGGAPVSDVEGERRIPDLRMGQAAETGAAVVAVACPTCTAMLEGVTGARPEVKDIAELLLEAVEAAGAAPAPRRAAVPA